jgi:hypothetical protein
MERVLVSFSLVLVLEAIAAEGALVLLLGLVRSDGGGGKLSEYGASRAGIT